MKPAPSRVVNLVCLILAGEMIFSLPFHITRYFRPSFLETFSLSNAALGDIFAIYGLIAMLSYFPGGLLADRFSVRHLLTFSLLATAAGGLYLATIPGVNGLRALFAYWGLTTILLFWAALLRATREWGGSTKQGRAFGLLDGGRGLSAAIAATIAVGLFSLVVGDQVDALLAEERRAGMQTVFYFYSTMTALVAILCWSFVRENTDSKGAAQAISQGVRDVGANPCVWLQAAVVLTAYCAYKGLDNYGVYMVDVLQIEEVRAAELMTISAYLRPLGAITAGFVSDRFRPSQVIVSLFASLVVIYMVLANMAPTGIGLNIIMLNLWVSFVAVFALRGVYFALLQEGRVARAQTGTAIGVVSVVGFTPDIFFYAIGGRLLDQNPGIVGHQHYFGLLAAIAVVGLISAIILARLVKAEKPVLR